jgi:hypothetical protein
VLRKGPQRAWRADLALAFITLIWGSTFVVVKEALADSSTLLFLALRFSLAAVSLAIVFRPLPSKFSAPGPLLKGGILAGLCLFSGYAFQTFGLRYTTPSKSAFITGLSIVLVPAFNALLQRRAPHPSEALGVLIAAAGMALMTLRADSLRAEFGDLLTLGCAAAFAAHILVRPLRAATRLRGIDPRSGGDSGGALRCELLVGGDAGDPVEPRRDRGGCRHRTAGHRTGVRNSGLGAAIYYADSHSAHLRVGAGFRLGHVIPGGGRTALGRQRWAPR